MNDFFFKICYLKVKHYLIKKKKNIKLYFNQKYSIKILDANENTESNRTKRPAVRRDHIREKVGQKNASSTANIANRFKKQTKPIKQRVNNGKTQKIHILLKFCFLPNRIQSSSLIKFWNQVYISLFLKQGRNRRSGSRSGWQTDKEQLLATAHQATSERRSVLLRAVFEACNERKRWIRRLLPTGTCLRCRAIRATVREDLHWRGPKSREHSTQSAREVFGVNYRLLVDATSGVQFGA